MEKLRSGEIRLGGTGGRVFVRRNEYGVPLIRAEEFDDLVYGLGWVHAYDRPVELELTRLIAKGVGAEFLDGTDELIASDTYLRRYNLWGDSCKQVSALEPGTLEMIEMYCSGLNYVLANSGRPFEFKLIGHRPEPWTPADCILMTKLIGLIDLNETQGWVEKFIVQMLQQGVPLDQVKEMFPYLTDEPGDEFLDIIRKVKLFEPMVPETLAWKSLPSLKASNNWVVAGSRSASGKPILCGDPHLDTARLPAIWQEVMMRSGDFWYAGCTIPGIPFPALGRTNDLAWSPTYGYMDVIDFFVEEVKDGCYQRGDDWREFSVRTETINVKKGEPRTVRYYENEHGVLDGIPDEDGYYLCMAYTLGRGCGADTMNHGAAILKSATVAEAMPHFGAIDFSSQNWVCADSEGNIGYHQSGRLPVRAEGCSGLLPMPGWDEAYDWKGTYPVDMNPSMFNPPEGFIGTANQDMNAYAKVQASNLPMADYRARRIHELLAARDDHTVLSMEAMHYDRYSKHAEDYMPLIRPLLPDGPRGDLLRNWDLRYESDSIAATAFENVFRAYAKLVFGELSLGGEVMGHIMDQTIIFSDFTINFDNVLLKEDSAWFAGKPREELLRTAISRGLAKAAPPWGSTRMVMMNNLMFAGRLPKFLGFDYGPIEIIGNRATIPQGQIFITQGGRQGTFSPAFKFVTDFAEDCIHSVTAGGPSDRRFSRWYTSGIADWIAGRYRAMCPKG
ncbi:MAG: penicillin acylase family protein [Candidatus Geothermincolia bacterium]